MGRLTLGQMPHPMHRLSEIKAIFDSGVTSMHSFPVLTTGQDFLPTLVSDLIVCCAGNEIEGERRRGEEA